MSTDPRGRPAREETGTAPNPVAALISVPFQNYFEWGAGQGSEGFRYLLNFQPVIPISLTKDWNLKAKRFFASANDTPANTRLTVTIGGRCFAHAASKVTP